MSRPIQAVVHLDALRHNLQIARQYAGDSQVYAVVKANAYGHGIERVYPAFQSADGFALLDLAEALRLRQLGWQGDILLLEGIFCLEDLFVCQQHCLSFSIHSAHQIDWLQQFQRQQRRAGPPTGGDRVGADRRGKGVGRVDHMGDGIAPQGLDQTFGAAEAAGPRGQGLRHRPCGASGIGIKPLDPRPGQGAGQGVRLGRAAKDQDVHHG